MQGRMENYEIRLYRPESACSAWYFIQCASDHHALATTQSVLNDIVTTASVWQGERPIGELAFSPADRAAA